MAYSVSEDFRTKCYSGESLYNCRLIIGSTTIPVTQISSITISSPIIDDQKETFYIGTFISQKLTIKFKNLDGIDTTSGTNVELYISQYVNGSWEEVPIGKYIIDESPENYHQTAEIECFDYAIKFATNLDYSPAFVDNKIAIDDLLQWICDYYNVTLGSYPDTNGDVEIGTYDSTVSGKQWISYIAEIKGCNAKMDRLGRLTLVPLKSSPVVTIDALKSKSWELGEKFEVSKVVFFDAIRNYTFGDDSENTLYLRQDNPFIVNQQVVRNVYENLRLDVDDVTQGKSFSINNTIDGEPFEDFALYGDTSQSGTPAPSAPQPINVVTGEQDINVCGKNLLDLSQVEIGKAWNNSSNNARAVCYVKVEPSTKYTISYNNISTFEGVYNFEKANKTDTTATSSVSQITATKTITTQATSQYLGLQFNKSSISSSDFTGLEIQIEKSESKTTYEAYNGNTYEINLGKNLLTKEGLSTPTTDTDFWFQTDHITPQENGWCRYQATNTTSSQMFVNTFTKPKALDIEPNTQYTIVVEFRNINTIGTSNNKLTICQNRTDELFTNSMDVTISTATQKVVSTTKSDINTATGLRIFYRLYANESVDFEARVSVIKGDYSINNFEYSPYKTPIELCKIGTYQDKILKGTGKNLFDVDYSDINTNLSYKSIYVGNGSFVLSTTTPLNTSSYANLFFLAGQVTTGASTTTNGVYVNRPITVNSVDGYVTVAYRNSDNVNPANYDTQLEKGTTPTEFEPYGFGGKWYIHKETGKYEFKGNEAWNRTYVSGSESYVFWKTFADLGIPEGNNGTKYCNYFPYENVLWGSSTVNHVAENRTGEGKWSVLINVATDIATSVNDWNSWLTNHKTVLYYQLLNPINTEITDAEILDDLNYFEENATYKAGITNISSTAPITFRELTSNPFICYTLTTENYGDISLDAWDTIHYTLGSEDYYTLNNNTIDYAMTIMSKVETKIPTKQQEVTTNVVGGNDEVKIRRLSTEINTLDNRITIQAEEIDENTDSIASLNLRAGNIETTVSNNYSTINDKFADYALNEDLVTIGNSVTQLQTDTYTKTEINTKLTDGSVTKVMTTSGTFDADGMHYEKTNAPTKTTINEKGVEVDSTSSGNELLFAGYDNNTNQTIVRTENINVRRYLVIGENSRMEDYGSGGGMFIL